MADKPTSTHGADGKYIRTADTAERDAEACRLRSRRVSYAEIARVMGYSDRGTAWRAVQRGLAAIPREPAAEVLQLELEKLDLLERVALEVLERTHVTVSHGQVVLHQGDALVDDAPVLQAVDRILKIQERRAKLLGLDAPKRLEVVTLDWLDEQIRTLTADIEQQLADLDGADAAAPGAPPGTPPA